MPGVAGEHETDAREGLQLVISYVRDVFGRIREHPFTVRLLTGPLESCAFADAWRSLFINFVVTNECWIRNWETGAPPRVSRIKSVAHEYTHLWQGEPGGRGCMQSRESGYVSPRWFVEGMAEYVAHEVLIRNGFDTTSRVVRRLEDDRRDPVSVRVLETSEWPADKPTYRMSHAAVRQLVERSRTRSLLVFCETVGKGSDWKEAFAATFGLSADDFYSQFERWLAARPGFEVTGRVTNASTGEPIGGVVVEAASPPDGFPVTDWSRTDPSGTFRLRLPDGTYRIWASPDFASGLSRLYWQNAVSFLRAANVTVGGRGLTGLDFVLPRGFLVVGRVTDSAGEPVAAKVGFNDGGHLRGGDVTDPATGRPINVFVTSIDTDADGRFRVRLQAGTYQVNIWRSDNCCASPALQTHVTVRGSDDNLLELKVSP